LTASVEAVRGSIPADEFGNVHGPRLGSVVRRVFGSRRSALELVLAIRNPRYVGSMTEEERDLIRALWWVCGELRAGNQPSADKLLQWEQRAQMLLQSTVQPEKISWDLADLKARFLR
jgi:hypothetical protein